ncbi:MAG: hypothetical protein D6782_06645, partial [Alphaproteobacteria bacterium]
LVARGKALADGLKQASQAGAAASRVRQAARSIVASAETAANSAFFGAADLAPAFRLPANGTGHDLGPAGKAPYPGFARATGPADGILGDALRVVETSADSTLLSDGIAGVGGLAMAARGADLRLYLISTGKLDGNSLALPFGAAISDGGNAVRIVDVRTSRHRHAVTFGAQGIGHNHAQRSTADGGAQAPLVVSVPAQARDGRLAVDLEAAPNATTYINGVIVAPNPAPAALAQVQRLFAPFINPGSAIAAGPGAGAQRAAARRVAGITAVSAAQALAGAIRGDEAGLATLQAYLDGAAGDLKRLEDRALRLIDKLADSEVAVDFLRLAETANRIIDAAATAAASSYTMPLVVTADAGLAEDMSGWDFGYAARTPATG